MNIFRFFGDMSHILSFIILLYAPARFFAECAHAPLLSLPAGLL